jgi:hypothetical protein
MGWIWYSGKACMFSGNPGDMILQSISQSIGTQYVIKFTISGMTQGILRLNNYSETHDFEEDGTFAVIGTASSGTLIFTGELDDSEELFNGCIDSVEVYSFASQTTLACAPCIYVAESLDSCLLLVTAENSINALNFSWDDLVLKARVGAKFARADYQTDKEELDDNGGDHIVTYFDGKKNRDFLVNAAPVYIHDFLFMCMGVDTFKINDVEYSLVDDKYPSITWNKSLKEGTVELKVRKKNYRLNKTNCG